MRGSVRALSWSVLGQASKQASSRERAQERGQVRSRAKARGKAGAQELIHFEEEESEPCPVGACFIKFHIGCTNSLTLGTFRK